MRLVLAALTALLLLAGCGGPHRYDTASALADDISCTTTYYHTLPPYTDAGQRDAGYCTLGGDRFDLKVYGSHADLTGALTLLSGAYVYAANWVVLCVSKVDCQAVQKSTGGTLAG